ncbi:MAG: hypothetical protein HUU06_05665 [Planctomycetaceae bacterium]|nr:YrhB family protein [Planctomycetota bacterium]NUN52260.1 hypothetical protein [Planctomycetaceae bacterium]
MITLEVALTNARTFLETEFAGHDLVIIRTVERPIGWGFVYQYRRYLETRNPDDMLIGPGPLLVLRSDGSVVQLRTFQSLEDEMRDYARSHP